MRVDCFSAQPFPERVPLGVIAEEDRSSGEVEFTFVDCPAFEIDLGAKETGEGRTLEIENSSLEYHPCYKCPSESVPAISAGRSVDGRWA